MDQYKAKELAQEWVGRAWRLQDDPFGLDNVRHGSERAEDILIRELIARVPDHASTHVAYTKSRRPLIVSVDQEAALLREITIRPFALDEDGEQAMMPPPEGLRTICRLTPLDPSKATCTTDTHWLGGSQDPRRHTSWTFRFGDHSLVVQTEAADTQDASEEALIHKLFQTLGWGTPTRGGLGDLS